MLTIPSLWRVLGILLLIAPASAAITSISISSDTDLQSALVDDSIQEIVVEQDITLERDHWVDWYSRQEPFVRSTNLTIRGFPPLRKLDLAFTGDGRLQLAAGVFLNISNIILEHARWVETSSNRRQSRQQYTPQQIPTTASHSSWPPNQQLHLQAAVHLAC